MLKVGILGLGRVATRHLQGWQAAGAKVSSVCGHYEHRVEEWLTKHNLDATPFYSYRYDDFNEGWHENIDEFLSQDFDAVSITTPPHDHAEQVRLCMKAGKHVLVEKPVYCSAQDVEDHASNMFEAQLKHYEPRLTRACFVNRWFPTVEAVKYQVNWIGDITSVQATYCNALTHEKPFSRRQLNTPRGVMSTLLSSGCHIVDLAQWVISSLITEVRCLTPRYSTENPQRSSELLVKYDCGAVGTISVSDECFHPFAFRLLVQGKSGSVELTETHARMYSHDGEPGWVEIPGTVPHSGALEHLPYESMIGNFAHCIRERARSECGLDDPFVLRTHEVCLAAEQSAQRNGELIVFRSM